MTLTLVSLLGPNVDEASIALTAALERSGISVVFDPGLGFAARRRLVETGEADVVWMCGLLAVEHAAVWDLHPIAAPVFVGAGGPEYRSVIVSRRPSASLAELCEDGVVWAMNEPESWSGHRGVLAECELRGLRIPSDVVWSGSHLDSIRMVAAGEADAAGIDESLWRWAEPTGVEVVDETRSWPSPPVTVRRSALGIVPDLAARIAATGASGGVTGFVPADERHLDPIRESVMT